MLKKLIGLIPALALSVAVAVGPSEVRADRGHGHWKGGHVHHHKHHGHRHKHYRHSHRYYEHGHRHGPRRKAKRYLRRQHTADVRRVVVIDRGHRERRHYRHSAGGSDFLNLGSAIGGLAGGVLGNQIGSGRGKVLATVGGVVAGALIGNSIYQGMQRADELRVARTLETVPSGQVVEWRNPDTGARYRMTPKPAFKDAASRRNCRDYTTWAFVDGYERELNGTACRTSDGRWELVN